jgi:hypothetical protein
MSFRTFGLAAVTGLALLSGIAATATPASAHGWGWGEQSHRYERDGHRYNRDGWYDRYGNYHRYEDNGSYSSR